jgi:large subunit ribosomal protein L29
MKAAEVREMDTEELHGRISELKEELFNLRFQGATGQLDNHRRMRSVKQEVARIRTILRERDFVAAEAAGTPVPPASATAPVTAPETREQAPEPSAATPEVPVAEESTE